MEHESPAGAAGSQHGKSEAAGRQAGRLQGWLLVSGQRAYGQEIKQLQVHTKAPSGKRLPGVEGRHRGAGQQKAQKKVSTNTEAAEEEQREGGAAACTSMLLRAAASLRITAGQTAD